MVVIFLFCVLPALFLLLFVFVFAKLMLFFVVYVFCCVFRCVTFVVLAPCLLPCAFFLPLWFRDDCLVLRFFVVILLGAFMFFSWCVYCFCP